MRFLFRARGRCDNSEAAFPPCFRSWSLGEANSRLSYYDGLIQLIYSNGSQYNNEQHTARSALISFMCDPDAGAGHPEFQVEFMLTSCVLLYL